MSASDALLLQRWVKRADAEAFAELVARHSGLVYGTCRRILANATEAEDLTQECFLKLSQHAPRETTSLAGWLHRVATNGCLDRIRAERRRQGREAAYVEGQAATAEPTWDEIRTCVDEAVAGLPEELRLPVLYHFFEGRSHLETARMLGLTRSGVTRRLQRGVEQIRETLGKRGALVSVAALAGMFTSHAAEAAPASLTASLARIAVAGHSGGVATVVATSLAVKIAAAIVIVLAVAGIAAWPRFQATQATLPERPSTGFAAGKSSDPIAPKPAAVKTAAVVAAAVPGDAKRTVQGMVVSTEGYPRPDVTFMGEGEAESSDAVQSEVDGAFTLADISTDATRWFAHSCNTGKAALFSVTPEGALPLRVVLDLDTVDVLGRVVDVAGKAVFKTRVELRVTNVAGESYALKPRSADHSGYYEFNPVPTGDGLIVEARTLPPGDEAPGPWGARKALARGLHGLVLEDLVVSEETARNIAANQPEESCPCVLDVPERERIGGIVQDEAGRPIAGVGIEAKVDVSERGYSWYTDTDAAGHWSLPIPKNAAKVSLRVEHRDYVGTVFDRDSKTPPLARLRDGSAVLTLKRGLRVQGIVRDAQGKAVADALVLPHRLYSTTASGAGPTDGAPMEDDYSVRTSPNGAFAFSCLPSEKARLQFLHPAYAPKIVNLAMAPRMAPLDVVLDEGGVVRGRVVDEAGRGIPEAQIHSDEWVHELQNDIVLHATTDADGAFEIRHVPTEGSVRFGVRVRDKEVKERFMPVNMKLAPREEPYTITLYVPPTFTGTVVDDATGKPVTEFHVRSGWYQPEDGFMYWTGVGTDQQVRSESGEFSLKIERIIVDFPNTMRFGVGVGAPGYFTAVSPLKRLGEPMEPFVLRLRKGQAVTGVVCDPSGKAVAGAQVATITTGHRADVVNGTLARGTMNGPEDVTETDEHGGFELPPCEGGATLLVLHASGYLYLDTVPLVPNAKLTLTPWAKVEGVSYASGVPEANAAVSLRPARDDEGAEVRWMLKESTHIDGRFEFDKLPAMTWVAERVLANFSGSSHGVFVVTGPGGTAYVELGTGGRQAVGQVICDAPQPLDPRDIRACAISREDPEARYGGVVEPDGRLHIENLPEGSYTLVVEVYDRQNGARLHAGSLPFAMPGGAADAAEDIGTLRLERFVAPGPGGAAPNFRGRTLDGQDFSLDGLQGKYVVLEFWRIDSSGPENVTRARDLWTRYGTAGNVAFAGVNFNKNPKDTVRYVQENNMPWTQVQGTNPIAAYPILGDYGVTNFPSLWIIGPDGSVVARDLTAETAAATLKAALGF